MPTDNLDNHKSLPIAFRGYDREPVASLLAQAEKSNSSLIAERDNLREDLEHAKKRLSEATSELEQHHATEEQAVAAAASRTASLEAKSRGLAAELDESQTRLAHATRRLSEVEEELATYQQQQLALADALIAAELLKAQGRDQGEALRLEAERKAAEILECAEQEAQQIAVRAEQEAETIRRDAHLKAETIVSEAETSKIAVEKETQELRARAEAEAEGLLADAAYAPSRLCTMRRKVLRKQTSGGGLLRRCAFQAGFALPRPADQIAAMSEEQERAETDQPVPQERNEAEPDSQLRGGRRRGWQPTSPSGFTSF